MTIELLLSMQGQGANSSSNSSAAPGSPRAAQGMFLQAFTQAASLQARTLLTNAQAENTPTVPLSDIVEQLASLDSELDEKTLSTIVASVSAQGQAGDTFSSGVDTVAPAQTLETASAAREQAWTPEHVSPSLASEGAETTTQITIEEVASRLALIASYSTPPTATNHAGSSAQSSHSAASSLATATATATATAQASSDSPKPANASPSAASFLDRTTLAMPAALSDRALAAEPTPLARTQGQGHTQTLASNQPATLQTSSTVATNSGASSVAPLPANGTAATSQDTPGAAPRDVQVALTGERAVAEAPRATSQPIAPQATAQAASLAPASASPQGMSPASSAGSASVMSSSPANAPAAALQGTPARGAAPRDGQIAQTGERAVAEAPRTTTQLTAPQPTSQATVQPASLTPASASPQGLSPAPSAGSAPVTPPLPANAPAAALQNTPASATPRDVQIAQTGERAVAEAPRPTTQATAQPASSTTNSGAAQGLSPAPSTGSAPVTPPLPANAPAAALQDTPASATPRDGQVAQAGERAVAEAPRPTTQATAQSASSTTNSGAAQGLSPAPSTGSAPVTPPLPANAPAAALQAPPASAAPRDGQVAQTGERAVAEAPRPTTQATAQPASSTTNSGAAQGLSPAPSTGSAPVIPPLPANAPAATLQDTPASTAPRDGQVAQTGEKAVAEALRSTTQATAQPASSTTNSGTPQGLAPAPSTSSMPVTPPLPANAPAATLQDTPASVAQRDGQVAQTGERAAAEAPRATTATTHTPNSASASVMPPLPVNSSATALPTNTAELAQSAAGSSLTSALAATSQAVGVTGASRPTPSSVNALPTEAATKPANVSALPASLETIPAQPFTTMQPGMHALSPLNTALASTPTMNADAMMAGLLAEAETASATSGASKGSEQVLPASLTSQNQAMPNSPATATLNTPLTSPAWPSQLGQQLIQFAQRGGEHQVKMQLHPAELGPLSITLKVTEQGTQAHFLSSHAPVRQAIEQAIPQLREALAEQGISLGETSVGEQQNPNEQAFAQQTPGKAAGSRGGELGNDDSVPSPIEADDHGSQDGRVDLYA